MGNSPHRQSGRLRLRVALCYKRAITRSLEASVGCDDSAPASPKLAQQGTIDGARGVATPAFFSRIIAGEFSGLGHGTYAAQVALGNLARLGFAAGLGARCGLPQASRRWRRDLRSAW